MGHNYHKDAIEEGTIIFSNQTEKDITFAAASDTVGFKSTPVVSIISAAQSNRLLSAQKNLLHGPNSGSYVPTFSKYDHAASGVTLQDNLTYTNPAHLLPMGDPKFSLTLGSPKPSNKYARLGFFDGITIPFNNTTIKNDGIVQMFLLVWFANWDADANDDARFAFVNKAAIDANSDTTPTGAADTQMLKIRFYIENNNSWEIVKSVANSNTIDITGAELNTASFTSSFNSGWKWIRIDMEKSSEDLTDLSGVFIQSKHNDAANEALYLGNAYVVIWDTGYDLVKDNFWSTGQDLFNSPAPVFTSLGSPNVNVTFSNVTKTGMKVITSAPFSGTIRYLCSLS